MLSSIYSWTGRVNVPVPVTLIKNSLDTAREQGFEKGHEKGRAEGRDERSIEIAWEMLADGESIEKIMRYTGLTETQIREIE